MQYLGQKKKVLLVNEPAMHAFFFPPLSKNSPQLNPNKNEPGKKQKMFWSNPCLSQMLTSFIL